ncbi:MAG: ComEC/Rec2 family competence protein, partial [Caulobacteraceae bacterium]
VHSDRLAAPVAPAGLGMRGLEGFVVEIENPSPRGERALIAPVRIAGLAPEMTPHLVRIVLADGGGPEAAPAPGQAIMLTALIDPPPGPAAPGAYDFARDAWFEGIGGVGLATQPWRPVELAPAPWRLRLEMAVNRARWNLAKRLVADIHRVLGRADEGAAGLAAAVTTSHQDWLPQADRDDLRASGLAHMLAIAGLHTAALSGFAFFAFRLAIAAWPWLALRVNGKKVAAAAALATVAAYLVLSGAHAPARRAAITASVAFAAILLDRRAISLHSLALAALAILVMEPEVVVQPGFEMSFCATASLLALAELWPRRAPARGLPWPLGILQRVREWTIAMFMVSLVAGAATSPFAIQHFNRIANYGVLANLSADFIASVALMPMLALCLLVEAVKLGHGAAAPLFFAAGWAANLVVMIGHIFARAPGSGMVMASAPPVALTLSYLGILFACLWRGPLRWIALPLAGAVALWPRPAPPVAWIASDGNDAAIVAGGEEIAMKPGVRLYATGVLAQRHGLKVPADPVAAAYAHFDCNRSGCAPIGDFHPAIGAWWTRRRVSMARLSEICEGADIFILRAPEPTPGECDGALVLRPADFNRLGAAEIYRSKNGWLFLWSQPLRGDRPWTLSGSGG